MKRKILFATVFVLTLITLKFWTGIYDHDEFNSKHIFFKHRPIWQTKFYAPRGMSDLKISDMAPNKQKEQILFDEFVLEQRIIH